MTEKIWVYDKSGEFLPGIPAQDITPAMFAALSEHDQEAVRVSDHYKQAEAKAPKPGAK